MPEEALIAFIEAADRLLYALQPEGGVCRSDLADNVNTAMYKAELMLCGERFESRWNNG